MPNYRRANTKGGTYFFTIVTHQRREILCDKLIRKSLRKALQTTRELHPFTIDAFVLLPDHMHCIWTLPTQDSDYAIRWAKIKKQVSQECGELYRNDNVISPSKQKRKESTIWQRRYWEHQIRDETDYQHHMDYIHYNPVKHGYTKSVKEWPYSSFHRLVKENVYPENWGGITKEPSNINFGEP